MIINLEPGDLATWFTGLITLALFIIAFIQIIIERNIRKKRDEELESNKIRSQAEVISAWIVNEGPSDTHGVALWISLLNKSTQPVYQVVISAVALGDRGNSRGGPNREEQACISVLPPGQWFLSVGSTYGGMSRRPGVEIAFQDAAGRGWKRNAIGELIRLEETTLYHYRIHMPADWKGLLDSIPVNPPRIGLDIDDEPPSRHEPQG